MKIEYIKKLLPSSFGKLILYIYFSVLYFFFLLLASEIAKTSSLMKGNYVDDTGDLRFYII